MAWVSTLTWRCCLEVPGIAEEGLGELKFKLMISLVAVNLTRSTWQSSLMLTSSLDGWNRNLEARGSMVSFSLGTA